MADQAFDLSKVRTERAGTVKLTPDGREHDVQHMTSFHHHALRQATAANAVERVFEAARAMVPTFSPEEHGSLTLHQAQAILAIASEGIQAAEALVPNVERPATPTSAA